MNSFQKQFNRWLLLFPIAVSFSLFCPGAARAATLSFSDAYVVFDEAGGTVLVDVELSGSLGHGGGIFANHNGTTCTVAATVVSKAGGGDRGTVTNRASPDSDYSLINTRVQTTVTDFGDGVNATVGSVAISINDDADQEANERFRLVFTDLSIEGDNCESLPDGHARSFVIVDDDTRDRGLELDRLELVLGRGAF